MDEGKQQVQAGWISSLDIIDKTKISRATLNNYIKMNILPRPDVKKPGEASVRARMLGYFPETVIDIIEQIKTMKKQGYSMESIIEKLKQPEQTATRAETIVQTESRPDDAPAREKFIQPEQTASRMMREETLEPLNLTINDIACPAYLLNNSFEIDWINASAENAIFQQKIRAIKEPSARNIFRLLMRNASDSRQKQQDFFDFHLSFVKEKVVKSDLDKLYEGISLNEAENLKTRYDKIEMRPRQTVNKAFLKLCDHQGTLISNNAYYMVFREGTLFIHAPVESSAQGIMDLFSCRYRVINDLLRQRMPTLVSFCVLVADLQNSVRICAELPPEEYFELINQMWACVEGSFKQYYGTYGKHTGDGMLYYFLKERDNQYMMNAVLCGLEIRENIKKLNMEWKIRRGWLNELHLNIGINEGQEYFGTIPSAPSVEFTALGDSVNYAGRLSDFARHGAIWTTKNLMNKLTVEEKAGIRYGIRRTDQDREILVENSYSRIIDMITQDNAKTSKFMDIATLAVTEILGRR
jgi:class 3 adenylate cyclase/DNA-binding transcriptional MerR regulator